MTDQHSIECPVCGGKSDFWYQLPEVKLYYCLNCSHRCTEPSSIKNPEEYSQDYFEESHKNWFENPDVELFQSIIDYADIQFEGKEDLVVLDVGCGNGAFLKYLKQKKPKYKLWGIDYHENQIEEGITYIKGDLFDQSFDQKFDIVTNLAVVEHIWDVQKFSRKLCDLTSPNSFIATMTINDEGLIYKITRVLRHFKILFPMIRLYDKHHINHFGMRSLSYLLNNNSHQVVEQKPHPLQFVAIDMNENQNILLKFLVKWVIFFLIGIEKFTGSTTSQLIFSRSK